MKKYIPAPIKETLRFRAEPQADHSDSTSMSKKGKWNEDLQRDVQFTAPRATRKVEDKALGVIQYADGNGCEIESNHPRSGRAAYDAEAGEELS